MMHARPLLAALAAAGLFGAAAQADTIVLYDADPDNNAATAAPDPASMGWFYGNIDGNTTGASFATPGTTTGGAQAWVLNDAGPTGAEPNQSNIMVYTLDASLIAQMDSGGFTLTMEFEQLSSGAFVGFGANAPGGIGLGAGFTRYGQSPAGGLQTVTYTYDAGTDTFTPNAGAGGPSGGSVFWSGQPGTGQIFFGDNTRNTSVFNLAITSVTLTGDDIVVPEPGSLALLGLGGLALLRRRRA